MSVKLLRTVKRPRTAGRVAQRALNNGVTTTTFRVTTYGYRLNGDVSTNLIVDQWFDIFIGAHTEYPLTLLKNQAAIIFPL